nr:hypothetical protein [Tanacetum cinerariifolium]
MGATREEFMNFLSASLTDRITEQVRNQLPQILPKGVSNFAPPIIKTMIIEPLNQVNLAKASSQPQLTYETATILTEFELKKILINKMNSSQSYLTAPKHQECYDDECPSAGSDRGLKKRKTSKDAEPATGPKNKDSSSRSSKGDDYPFDLFKPLPLITRGNRQSVPVEFFIKNDLKYLQGGILTMTYMMSTTKAKAAQYDLLGIKDMRAQHKSFYAYARGKQSRGDVYYTKRILAVTHVSVMMKHRYGYLEEIVVRRADNALYKFKEGDDVADFPIALRMFTRKKMEKIEKEKSTFHDQGHQQGTKGKEDDEEFREIPQERCNIKAFKLSYQEKYEHVGPEVPRSQDGEITRRWKEIMLG